MSQSNQLEHAVDHVIELAKKHGVEADVIAESGEKFSLKAESGELSEYQVSGSQVIGIRVVKDDSISISYSESLETQSLEQMVTQAVKNAAFTKSDPSQKIRAEGEPISTLNPEIFQTDPATAEEKVALALQLEQGVLDKPLAKAAPYNSFSESSHKTLLANTLGMRCDHSSRHLMCFTSTLIDQGGKQSMHYTGTIARTFAELEPQRVIDESYQVASDLLEGGPVSSGVYSVIFDTDSLSELFGAFGSCISGLSAQRGTNPWREKVGEIVASPLLTVTDKAYVEGGMAITAFDGEGFATQDTSLIADGKLVGLLHNSATAAHFGVTHTANASRSAKSPLSVSGLHKVLSPGRSSEAEVTGGEYLELIALQGTHSGADAISGDFSFGASGFLCRDGKRERAVRGITVAGNFYQMLKDIEAVSDVVLPNSYKSFFSPTIRFSGLNIAGE
ncbi:TldD/PmbA family protein [Veronia pacifica]|uniref:Zn-dependent protease n=1 Tax=Veronia pacifica TaxID=1080227 RepID=A0A1C3EIF7_9GAMM|nr:TldD/PmbA family protein [Veronia pacifica]ODA33008.1 Zn-dependent protease [Veronia pacifica]